jgi:hypothetical protein
MRQGGAELQTGKQELIEHMLARSEMVAAGHGGADFCAGRRELVQVDAPTRARQRVDGLDVAPLVAQRARGIVRRPLRSMQ